MEQQNQPTGYSFLHFIPCKSVVTLWPALPRSSECLILRSRQLSHKARCALLEGAQMPSPMQTMDSNCNWFHCAPLTYASWYDRFCETWQTHNFPSVNGTNCFSNGPGSICFPPWHRQWGIDVVWELCVGRGSPKVPKSLSPLVGIYVAWVCSILGTSVLVLCRCVLKIYMIYKQWSSLQLHCMKSMQIDTIRYHFFGEQSQGFLECHERIPMSRIDGTMMVLLFRKKENLPNRNDLQRATQIWSENGT